MPRSKIIAIMVATVVLGGGCSDGGEGGGAGSGLLGALGRVRATDSTRQYVEYGNVARVRSLVEADRDRFLSLTGYGMGNLGRYHRTVAEGLAFDPLLLREAVTAGNPPDWSGMLWGDYDVAAVNGKFAGLGLDRSADGDSTTWTAGANGEIRIDSPLVEIAGPNTLNNVRTAPGSFAFSPKRDTLAWVTDPGSDTLDRDPTIRALAHCLGDVVAATIARPEGDAETLAVGVRAASPTDVGEVICVEPGGGDPAAIRDHVTDQLANGRSPRAGRPWSELLPGATVEQTSVPVRLVRITATLGAGDPPGRVIQMLLARELDQLLGLR